MAVTAVAVGRRRAASLFVLGTFLFWASVYTYVPILPAYVERVSGSLQVVAWVIGAYGFTQLVLRVPLGVWSDRAGARKPFVLAGLVTAVVSGLGLALAQAPGSLVIFRGLAGVAAATWAVFTVLFSDYFTPADPRRAMTIMQVAAGVGQIAAALLGGWLAASWGWTAPFYAGALLAVLGLACVAAAPEPAGRTPARRSAGAASVARIARVRVVAGASIIAALAQCGFWATVNGFTPIYAVRLGASAGVLGVLAMVALVPYTAAPILGDTALFRRFRAGDVVAAGCLLVAVATAAVPFIGSIAGLMLAQVVGGVGRGIMFPILMTSALGAVGPQERGTAMGLFQATYALGMTGGPWLAAWLVGPLGLEGVFLTMAILTALGIAVALALLD
ncbi:MAG TPA: MFS transporter [Methylomirabilota bacterium]|nr:MFS transporter [Methylomirabilota bacterium]